MGTSSANRIFQLNAVGSLNPCDFCCLPRENEEHLVLGKSHPLFSRPKAVGKISQALLSRASTPQAKPSVLAGCHTLLQPGQGNTAAGSAQAQEPGHRWKGTER